MKKICNRMISLGLSFSILFCMITSATALTTAQAADFESSVNQTLSQLTLRERTKMMNGAQPGQDATDSNNTVGYPSKGLSYMNMSDGPLGINVGGSGTGFGSGLIIASTWDKSLTEKVGEVLGKEAKAKNIQMQLGPGINILRDLAGGRTFEYFSEDPYLTSNVAVPYVQGVQSEGVICTLKHYLANNQEYNRNFMSSNVSERALHEVYLPAFQAAIEQGGAYSVMTAANRSNGVFTSDNRYLLTNLLKYQYGLKGITMTDWIGVRTGLISAKAGLDLAMPYSSSTLYKDLEYDVRNGKLDVSVINSAAQRLVRCAYFTKSLVSTPQVAATGYTKSDRTAGELNSASNEAIAKQVAEEGTVLLKNNKDASGSAVLPINKNKVKSIALLGKYVNYKQFNGNGGSSTMWPPYEVTNLQGIKNELGSSVTLSTPAYDESNIDKTIADAVAAAKNSDYAIVFAGLNHTSTSDPNVADTEDGDRGNLNFPENQLKLIKAVAAVNSKTVVVLSGSVYEVRDWVDDVPAVLQTFYSGMEGGNATAEILFGDVNPSGKLSFTWPKRYSETEAYVKGNDSADQRTLKTNDVNYSEGVYVGYKYYDKNNITPEFAFGHGLSYTNFQYGNLKFSSATMGPGDTIQASVDITNAGSYGGYETAQLYIHEDNPKIDRPLKELKGYQKVYLNAGETKTVTFSINKDSLSYWDVNTHSYMADKGNFEAWIGSASDDILQKGTFTLTEDTAPDANYQVVQAEAATEKTDAATGTNKEVDGSGTSYLKLNGADSSAKWTVSVNKAGKYSIIFRYANNGYSGPVASSYGPNKVTSLYVNGAKAGDYDFQNTRAENIWNYDSIDVTLKAGQNEIALNATADTAGLLVDKMIVQTINQTTPEAAACAPDSLDGGEPVEESDGSAYQLEKATDLNDSSVASSYANYTGTGYVDLPHDGSSVGIDTIASTYSNYRYALYYANGGGSPAPCDLYVNGELRATFTLAPTGSYSTWKYEQTPLLSLNTGINTVKIVSGGNRVLLDKIVMSGGMGYTDTTAPVINATDPVNNGSFSDVAGSITVYGSEVIKAGSGASNITLSDGNGTIPCTAGFSGTVLTLQPKTKLTAGKTYTLTIPKTAIQDESGNTLAADTVVAAKVPAVTSYRTDAEGIHFSGDGWQSTDSGKITGTGGAACDFWFKGTSVSVTLPTGPDMGIAKMSFSEGAADQTVDLYSEKSSSTTYGFGTVSDGIHHVTITATSLKSTASGGTSVGIDQIDMLGALVAPVSKVGWTADGVSCAVPDTEPFSNAFDGDEGTRWSSGILQGDSGQWYTLNFGRQTDISSIVMCTANTAGSPNGKNDYARNYEVYVSNDGTSWGNAVATGTGRPGYTTIAFAKQHCQYVKIVQKGSAPNNWWCISELYAFDDVQTANDSGSPTPPTALQYKGYNTQIKVSWSGASDDAKVTGYVVYRDNAEIARTSNTFYIDSAITDRTKYSYSVRAMDASGHQSAMSAGVEAVSDQNQTALPMTDSTAYASVSHSTVTPGLAIDNDASTRWTTGVGLSSGQWFMVDLGSKCLFDKLTFTSNDTDFPDSYQVLVSDDGITWLQAAAGAGSKLSTITFPQKRARYVKLVATSDKSAYWWSIYNFSVANTTVEIVKTQLSEAVANAEKLVQANYTSASWAPFSAALTNAKAVLADAGATQAQIDDAESVLETAGNDLVPLADKTALKAEISAAEALKPADYTEDSWASFESALNAANAVAGNAEASQKQADDAVSALKTAVNHLVTKTAAEKALLKAAVDKASALAPDGYTAESWAAFQTALAAANAILAKTDATVQEIDDAIAALNDAEELLEKTAPASSGTSSAGSESSQVSSAVPVSSAGSSNIPVSSASSAVPVSSAAVSAGESEYTGASSAGVSSGTSAAASASRTDNVQTGGAGALPVIVLLVLFSACPAVLIRRRFLKK